MRFKDKVAIITGGGAGMGRAAALEFIKEGASVVINDFNDENLSNTVNEIQSLGGAAVPVPGDMNDKSTIQSIVRETIERFGKIDILFNYVGGEPNAESPKPFWEHSDDYLDILFNLNLKTTILLSRAVLDSMMKQKYGKIINTGAVAGRIPAPRMAVYGTVKAGVIAFTRLLALEVASYNINVNCVSPGPISTPGYEKMFGKSESNKSVSLTAIKRIGTPEEVAKAVLYLASDDASYITGQTLAIDGGATMI